jgi:hypothetical protein
MTEDKKSILLLIFNFHQHAQQLHPRIDKLGLKCFGLTNLRRKEKDHLRLYIHNKLECYLTLACKGKHSSSLGQFKSYEENEVL